MIFGFALVAGGYAVLYWGLHHFCNVDCPGGCAGGQSQSLQNKESSCSGNPDGSCCANRVSLIDALGIPSAWALSKGTPVQLNAATQNINPPQAQSPAQTAPNQTQPQNPSNSKTPSKTTPNQTPKACYTLVKTSQGYGWKNSQTGKILYQVAPPGNNICKGTKLPGIKGTDAGGAVPQGIDWKKYFDWLTHGGPVGTLCGWIPGCKDIFNG